MNNCQMVLFHVLKLMSPCPKGYVPDETWWPKSVLLGL